MKNVESLLFFCFFFHYYILRVCVHEVEMVFSCMVNAVTYRNHTSFLLRLWAWMQVNTCPIISLRSERNEHILSANFDFLILLSFALATHIMKSYSARVKCTRVPFDTVIRVLCSWWLYPAPTYILNAYSHAQTNKTHQVEKKVPNRTSEKKNKEQQQHKNAISQFKRIAMLAAAQRIVDNIIHEIAFSF